MKRIAFFSVNLLVIAFNVHVSEGATPPAPGVYTFNIPCNTPATIADLLDKKYQERLLYKGMARGGVMRFYGNEQTHTFTVSLEANGLSCLVTAGGYLMKQAEGTAL